MKRLRHIPLLLAAAPLLGGCATALPASEGVILYEHHYPPTETSEPARPRFRLPLFFTGSPIPKGLDAFAHRQTERRYGNNNEVNYDFTFNPKRFAGGLSLSAYRGTSTWVNLSLGAFTLGIDATTRLPRSWFATVNVGAFGGGEVILQKPVWLNRSHTLSVGGIYKLDRYAAEAGITCNMCIGNPFDPAIWLNVHSAGGRVMWQHVDLPTRAIFRLVASAGYAPTLRSPVARLGIFVTALRPTSRTQ